MAPKTDADMLAMKNKELNNGRLAMMAVAGIVAQEVVTGQDDSPRKRSLSSGPPPGHTACRVICAVSRAPRVESSARESRVFEADAVVSKPWLRGAAAARRRCAR